MAVQKIDELWEPLAKTWFTEGKDDPRITVIKVAPRRGTTGTPSTITIARSRSPR
ncbi:MAG: pyridoxamine 5'-phosphate oxidase family protein [Vicinamibacterales bacterium]